MKLKWQIYILSMLIFVLCAISFGLLHYDMRLEQSKLAYDNKITSLLISVGAFAKSDSSFIKEENICELIERAELESLEISKMQSKHRVVLENNPEIIETDYTLSATYVAGDFIFRASLLEEDILNLKDSFVYIILYWALAGLLFGLFAGFLIFKFLNSKIKLLEEKLFDETKSKIEILEFKDLMFSARLLMDLNKLRKEKEYYKLHDKEDSLNLSNIILEKLSPAKTTTFGKFKVSFDIANARALNSFYTIISDDTVLYGKINTKLSELESFANCIFIRDYAKKLIQSQGEQVAYLEISKLFDLEVFNTIKFEGDNIRQKVFTKDSQKEELLNLKNAILLGTQGDYKELALYTKLNFEKSENKLNFILKLLPEKAGGLYILIET